MANKHSTHIGIKGSFSLSTIEIKCLNIMWKSKVDTVRKVHEEILKAEFNEEGQGLFTPYTTVMSTMVALAAQGILKANKSQKTYYYEPAFTRDELAEKMVKAIKEAL